jgi:class 3 adenylate cyclase
MALDRNIDALLKARAEIDEQLREHKNDLTLLFTDIVGSTRFFDRFGDTAGLAMIHGHVELVASVVEQHNGAVIKTIGDSVMAEFPGPGSAVRAAIEIEKRLLELNQALPPQERVEVRIGIHTGKAFRKGNDLFGDVVNVAARITKRSAAAQILVSRAVFEAISEEPDLSCQWLSEITFDGKTEKQDIFEVIWDGAPTHHSARKWVRSLEKLPARTRRVLAVVVALLFGALVTSFLGHTSTPTPIQNPTETIMEPAKEPAHSAEELVAKNPIPASVPPPSTPARPRAKRADALTRGKEPKTQPSARAAKAVTVFYLDVGTFKEEAWAHSAADKLNQSGFHAMCVRKGRLWGKSYHVQVGPYTDPKEVEAAQQRLAAQGFKAHALKQWPASEAPSAK